MLAAVICAGTPKPIDYGPTCGAPETAAGRFREGRHRGGFFLLRPGKDSDMNRAKERRVAKLEQVFKIDDRISVYEEDQVGLRKRNDNRSWSARLQGQPRTCNRRSLR